MKNNHGLFIIILLFALSYGCSKDDLARSAYESLRYISECRNGDYRHPDDPLVLLHERESYDAYKQEREKQLKEEQTTEERRIFIVNRDIFPESKQEEVSGDVTVSNGINMAGGQSTLIGTWDSVEITQLKEQKSPTATSIRMVMTPTNDSFLILKNVDGSRDIWHSAYRIESDQLFVRYLMDPEIYRFKVIDGKLVIESDKIKVVFQQVK